MRTVLTSIRITAGIAASLFLALFLISEASDPAAAQTSGRTPAAAREGGTSAAAATDIPRMPDGKPDFTGVWWVGRDITPETSSARYRDGYKYTPVQPGSFGSLYQPWAAEKASKMSDKDDPSLWCIPSIIGPSFVGNGLVGEIVQTPKAVLVLIETFHGFRIIPTDGRPHRDDVLPSYRGESVGHWEGDTLVVDVRSFSDKNWLHHHGDVSFHSDELRIIEKYRLLDANTLQVELTAEDPKVLTGPWVMPPHKSLAGAVRSHRRDVVREHPDRNADGGRCRSQLRALRPPSTRRRGRRPAAPIKVTPGPGRRPS